jgi:hypothetical protein
MRTIENMTEACITTGFFPRCLSGNFVFGNDLKGDVSAGNWIAHDDFRTSEAIKKLSKDDYEKYSVIKENLSEKVESGKATLKDRMQYYESKMMLGEELTEAEEADLNNIGQFAVKQNALKIAENITKNFLKHEKIETEALREQLKELDPELAAVVTKWVLGQRKVLAYNKMVREQQRAEIIASLTNPKEVEAMVAYYGYDLTQKATQNINNYDMAKHVNMASFVDFSKLSEVFSEVFSLGKPRVSATGISLGAHYGVGVGSAGGSLELSLFVEDRPLKIFGYETKLFIPTNSDIGLYLVNKTGAGLTNLDNNDPKIGFGLTDNWERNDDKNRIGDPQNSIAVDVGVDVHYAQAEGYDNFEKSVEGWTGYFNNLYTYNTSGFRSPSLESKGYGWVGYSIGAGAGIGTYGAGQTKYTEIFRYQKAVRTLRNWINNYF